MSDGCVWWVDAPFLASPQFLAGFHLIRISRNEIESCPATLHESQMLWTDGIHKARESPYADNASQPLPPQLFTCGNQTSQDETQSSITSCPVVSWKCFILLNTEKKRYRWETGMTLAASKEKHQHRRGKTAHFFIWYRASISEWQTQRWLIPSLFWFVQHRLDHELCSQNQLLGLCICCNILPDSGTGLTSSQPTLGSGFYNVGF